MAGVENWVPGSTGYNAAIAAVGVMLAAAGIALGLGIGLRIRWLQDWGRDELIQSAINGALVGGLVLLFGSGGIVFLLMNDLVDVQNDVVLNNYKTPYSPDAVVKIDLGEVCKGVLSGGGGMTPSCYALAYTAVVESTLAGLIIDLSALVIVLAFVASININLVVVSFSPLSGLEAFVGIFSHAIEVFVMLATMAMVQALFIRFVDTIAIPILLPLGLILRSFFMTRKLGGAIMAIAIGLGVVFPLTFVLDGRMMTENFAAPMQDLQGNITLMGTSIKNLTNFNDLFKEPLPGIRVPDLNATAARINQTTGLYDSFKGSMQSISAAIAAYMSNVVMMIVILPFFNIILTLVSVRELASLFGSELGGGALGSL